MKSFILQLYILWIEDFGDDLHMEIYNKSMK